MSYKDIDQEHLYTILDKETADRVCRFLAGYRVVFKRTKIEHKEIYSRYKNMKKMNYKNCKIIEILAEDFSKSKTQIYRIIKKCKKKSKN